MYRRQIIFYSDELHDEFSKAQITPRHIGADYTYLPTSTWKRLTHFFWYRLVAMPVAFGYTKLVFGHRIVNKKLLRACGAGGCFLYGNHTQDIADAFIPNMLRPRKDAYMIVHPNNVSMPILGKITPSLGALPLPDEMAAYRRFMQAVTQRIAEGKQVVIYPEAHIWPFYTGIRPFPDTSFQYPVKLGVPTYCFTNTYRKRRFRATPRIVTYIDGPFYPDPSLSAREQKRDLRDRVHACMCRRAATSDVNRIHYIKKEKTDG